LSSYILIFYFMAIRPQQRQRKAHAALLSALKKGDTVVTAAGITGKVKRVEEDIVTIEVAKGVSMKFSRRAIVEIVSDPARARALSPEGTGGGRGKRGRAEIEESTYDEDAEGSSVDEADATDAVDTGETTDLAETTDESEQKS
jgi:preprotein translocase YajC subunit